MYSLKGTVAVRAAEIHQNFQRNDDRYQQACNANSLKNKNKIKKIVEIATVQAMKGKADSIIELNEEKV